MHATSLCVRTFAGVVLLSSASAAQALFDSPGQFVNPSLGQVDRFTNDFNPAVGVVIDGFADVTDPEGGNAGADAQLRLVEVNFSANVDPDAWAWAVFTSENLESPGVEEAAVMYTGLEGNHTIRAGQFFIDFGKQMQNHLEELRTLERPLPLREFLGSELAGVGVQYENWFALNDTTPVRFSIGAFSSLLGEGHEHEDEEEGAAEASVPDRKDVDEISFTARVTGMTDVGEQGIFQVGASARHVPEFTLAEETSGLSATGLSNWVYGVDVTYSDTDDTGLDTWLLGGEFLVFDGDLSGALDDPDNPTALQVVNDTATGFFVFGDMAVSQQSSVGVQYAKTDLAEAPGMDAYEVEGYFTYFMTEVRRLRLGVRTGENAGLTENAVYVQFTNFFGNHSHGLNW